MQEDTTRELEERYLINVQRMKQSNTISLQTEYLMTGTH